MDKRMPHPCPLSAHSTIRRKHLDRGVLFSCHVRPPAIRLCRICDVFPDNWNGFVTWECYASPVSIQFESHTVELWAIYTMEYDTQVLDFFD